MRRIEDWDKVWSEPTTRIERAAPLLALGLAVFLALWA